MSADQLEPGGSYYLPYVPAAPQLFVRRYICALDAASGKQPVYFFRDEFDRPYQAYTPDLLAYHSTRADALRSLIAGLERTVAVLKEQLATEEQTDVLL